MIYFLILVCCCVFQDGFEVQADSIDFNKEQTYAYFAYGSNLLLERLQRSINATRDGVGLLNSYRLDFDKFSKRWNGCASTIVPDVGKHVWGALWKVTNQDLKRLDKQESVPFMYKRIGVDVEKLDGTSVRAYTYTLVQNPIEYVPLDQLPKSRQPSKVYLEVIIAGARESGLPDDYQKVLQSIAHNSYNGPVGYDLD